MPLISYADVRASISLEQVLGFVGYRGLRRQGRQHFGRCPLGCSANPTVANFDLDGGGWRCFKCQRGGNHLELYAERKSLTLYAAALALCQEAGLPVPWLTQPARIDTFAERKDLQ